MKFKTSGVKRKSIVAAKTMCRKCNHTWIDKIFDEPVHKVICPKCNCLNATLQIDDCIEKVCMQAIRWDIGRQGNVGGSHFSKREIIKMLKRRYGEEKAREMFWKMMNDAETAAREARILPRETKITVKRKGQKDETL